MYNIMYGVFRKSVLTNIQNGLSIILSFLSKKQQNGLKLLSNFYNNNYKYV